MAFADETLSERTGRELHEAGLTIACAESCTGGLLTSTLTDMSGSSSYVMGSIVSYANHVKARILHVSEETLTVYGAVSEETAREMAENDTDGHWSGNYGNCRSWRRFGRKARWTGLYCGSRPHTYSCPKK